MSTGANKEMIMDMNIATLWAISCICSEVMTSLTLLILSYTAYNDNIAVWFLNSLHIQKHMSTSHKEKKWIS